MTPKYFTMNSSDTESDHDDDDHDDKSNQHDDDHDDHDHDDDDNRSNIKQYAKKISNRNATLVSKVYSQDAERISQTNINKREEYMRSSHEIIAKFEEKIINLHNAAFGNDDNANYFIKNNETYRILIRECKEYVDNIQAREANIQEELILTIQKSDDFEEQLEIAIDDLDKAEKDISIKDNNIIELENKINKYNTIGCKLCFITLFYTYIFGAFGIFDVICKHLLIIGMIFHTFVKSIHLSFEIGANTTKYIIDSNQMLCEILY